MVGVPVTMPNVRTPNRARKFKLWLIRSTMRLLVLLVIALNLAPATMAQDTPTPVPGFHTSDQANSFAGDLSTIYSELDRFWADVFRVHGQAYGSPGLAPLWIGIGDNVLETSALSPDPPGSCGVSEPHCAWRATGSRKFQGVCGDNSVAK